MNAVHRFKPLLSALAVAATIASTLALTACQRAETPQVLIESGKQLDAKRDFRGAVIQYMAALQVEPNSSEARFLMGQARLAAGDAAGAAVDLAKALELKVAPERVLPPLARALVETGDFKKLTSQYGDAVLQDKAAQSDLKASLAKAWAGLGDVRRAEAATQEALSAAPDSPAAQLLNASLMAGRREFDKALALVEQILARDPSRHEAWMLRGEIEVTAHGDRKAGEAAFRKVLEIEPRYIPAHTALISQLMIRGDIAAAKQQATRLRELIPGQPQSSFIDAVIAFNERDLPKAKELVQQTLRLLPDSVPALHLAGVIEGQLGALVLAENYFSRALSLAPGLGSARVNLARVYMTVGQPAKALDTLAPLLGPASNSAEAQAMAGEVYLRMGDARAAEDRFNRATALNPDDVRSRTSIASARLSRGDADAALEELGSLAQKSKDIAPDLAIVSARLSRGEYLAALAAIDALEKKQPRDAKSTELRGRVQWAMKDYPAARKSLETALKTDPTLFAAVLELVDLDLLEKKPEQARKRLESAIAADPRNPYARLRLVDLRAKDGADISELRSLLAEAIKNSPTAVEPRLQLIELLLRKRLFKDVQAAAQEAAATFGNDPNVLDAVGRAEMGAGNLERAISTFRKLAGLVPNSATPYVRLASAYAVTGQRESIETALKKALELDPNSPPARLAYAEFVTTNNQAASGLGFARDLQQKNPGSAGGYLLEAAVQARQKTGDAGLAALRKGLGAVKGPSEIPQQLYGTEIKIGHNAEADRFATDWLKSHPDDAGLSIDVAAAEARRGQLAQAQSRLEAVLSKNARNVLALNNLADLLVKRGKPGAVALAQQASDLAPNQPAIMDTLASALAADKRTAEALDVQKKAVDLAPTEGSLRLNLARIALQAGDKATAKSELERLRAMGDAFREQNKVADMMKAL